MLEWSSWPVNPLKLLVTFNAAVAKALQSCPTLCDPRRWKPTRLPYPWDSPDKNTRVGCHFLLQLMKVKSESKVAQSCPTLSDPMDCSLPGSSIHGFSRQEYWSRVPWCIKSSFICGSVSGPCFLIISLLVSFPLCNGRHC